MKKILAMFLMILCLGNLVACTGLPQQTEPTDPPPTVTEAPETTEAPVPTNPAPAEPITLGDHVELFVDDYLIQSSENITLGITEPEAEGLVYAFDGENEGGYSTYCSIFQNPENGLYYLYYRGMQNDPVDSPERTCLALSEDGINFEPVDVGDGTNVLFWQENMPVVITPPDEETGKPYTYIRCQNTHNFAPFYDTNPDCPPEERFKAACSAWVRSGSLGTGHEALIFWYSADGIHWEMYEDTYITDGMFDSLNTAFWDEVNEEYRLYSRCWTGEGYTGMRCIQLHTSKDFKNWTDPQPNIYNSQEEPPYELYTNAIRQVPGAENFYVGFPMRFNPDRHLITEHWDFGVSDCMFISSRDGHDWTMTDASPWIYPGLDKEEWTERNFIVSTGIIEIGDYFNLYVNKHYNWDSNALYRYTLPRHRFGYAYSTGGTFTTHPFTLGGSGTLTFNFNTSSVGTMRVKVLDENGEKLVGFEYYGNFLDKEMDLSPYLGQKLQLQIELEDAYLYAIGYAE